MGRLLLFTGLLGLSLLMANCSSSRLHHADAGQDDADACDPASGNCTEEPLDESLEPDASDSGADLGADLGADNGSDDASDGGTCPSGTRPVPTLWINWQPLPIPPPLSAYVLTNDTVLDQQTCLMWQRNVTTQLFDWVQAKTHCDDLELAGYTDWRLPTVVELRSILDLSRHSPTINVTAFPDTPFTDENWFWTSTSTARDPTYLWAVGFLFGISSPNNIGGTIYVRCVR